MLSNIFSALIEHIQNPEILYEFDVRFTPKRGSPICHVLLTVQNTHLRALLFIDNRQFIGFCTNSTKQQLQP